MVNSKFKQTKTVSLKSTFILVNSKRKIAENLTFSQAKQLAKFLPSAVIKFQAMVRVEVSV